MSAFHSAQSLGQNLTDSGYSATVSPLGDHSVEVSTVDPATAEDVKQSLEQDTAAGVNVLAAEDHDDEHIPDTANIPYDEVEERFPEEFDRSDDIIVYCLDESRQASPESAATLEAMGFESVRDYEEGIAGWKERGYETTSAN
jgi:rhodanese-related sulfurtransferase